MIYFGVLSAISEALNIADFNVFLVNLVFAIILLVIGVVLGKFIKLVFKKIISKSGIERTTKKTLVELFLAVIKWSVYILFVSLALNTLKIPQLTNWLTSVLVVIPALVGALLLIVVGFAIAIYLKDVIEESKILGWEILSKIFFYFITYVFMIYALRTALISQDRNTVNLIILILTAVVAGAVAYRNVRK